MLAVAAEDEQESINHLLDKLTKFVQKRQRENGKSFVSRTRIEVQKYNGRKTLVFRVVLANPLTTKTILQDVLAEQTLLAQESETFLPTLLSMAQAKAV